MTTPYPTIQWKPSNVGRAEGMGSQGGDSEAKPWEDSVGSPGLAPDATHEAPVRAQCLLNGGLRRPDLRRSRASEGSDVNDIDNKRMPRGCWAGSKSYTV